MQPHAPELEEAVIGACLIEQEALPLIADKLRPEMFYDDHHQLIFAALMAMYHAGKKIDILTVKEELARRGNLDAIGGPYAIVQLSSKVASSAHIEYHAQIIHQKYLAREMVVGFNKLLTCAMDIDGTAALCEEVGVVAKAAIAKKALPKCNIVYRNGQEMKKDISAYLQVLYDASPAAVGGKLPDDNFYYTEPSVLRKVMAAIRNSAK